LGNFWYIVTTASAAASYGFTTFFKAPLTTTTLTVPASNDLTIPAGYNWLPGSVPIPISQQTVSNWIQPTFTATNTLVGVYADGSGECAAEGFLGAYEGEASNVERFRTLVPNINGDVIFSAPHTPATFDVSFAISAVACQVPTGLTFCTNVKWPIADWEQASLLDSEAALIVSELESELSSTCLPIFSDFLCAVFMPKCDSNQFDSPPCVADCTTFTTACGAVLGTINCQNYNPPSDNFCYLPSGGSSTTAKSDASVQSISVFFVAMALLIALLV